MSEDKNRKPSGSKSTAPRSGQSKPAGSKSTAPRSGQSKPSGSKSAAPKSGQSKPSGSKSTAPRSGQSKPAGSKSAAPRSGQSKPAGSKSTAPRSGQSKPAAKSGSNTPAKNTRPNRRRTEDVPRNPRRDTEDERELRRSANAIRIAQERRHRKYIKNQPIYNILLWCAITVAVLSVVIILSGTVVFNISAITVQRGKDIRYTDEEIIAACGIEPGDNLFAIDIERAALDVTTNLPYIEVCNISRRLPYTLELDVHSAVVLGAATTSDGAYVVLSASGRALEYAETYNGTEQLTRINGIDMTFGGIGCPAEVTDPDELRVAAELVVGFSLYDLKLDSITFDQAGMVTARYDDRININFGVSTNLSQKVQVAAIMFTEGRIARNEAGNLDLSIDERAIFTPDYLL